MNDNKLKSQFFAHFNLKLEPQVDQATLPAAGALSQIHAAATAAHRASPTPVLSQEERESLSGKRFPALPEAMTRCAEALAKHPRITADTAVSPASLHHTQELDTVGVRIAQGCAEVHARSGEAVRLAAGQAEALGSAALQVASHHIEQGAPTYFKQLFAEALLGQQGAQARAQARAERTEDRTAPLKAQTEEAQARLRDAQTLARFLLKKKED
jgi:hypothetical protein